MTDKPFFSSPFFCLHTTWIGGTDPRVCLKRMSHPGEHNMTPMADPVRSKFVHHHQLQGLCRAIYVPEPGGRPLVCLRDTGHLTPHGLPEGRTEGPPRSFLNTDPINVPRDIQFHPGIKGEDIVVPLAMVGRPDSPLQDQELLVWPAVDEPPAPERSLPEDLRALLRRHSAENGSDTPDLVLADFLLDALSAFNDAVTAREDWYGHRHAPGEDASAQERLKRIKDLVSSVAQSPGGAGGPTAHNLAVHIHEIIMGRA